MELIEESTVYDSTVCYYYAWRLVSTVRLLDKNYGR
jgi:hypothetical protein